MRRKQHGRIERSPLQGRDPLAALVVERPVDAPLQRFRTADALVPGQGRGHHALDLQPQGRRRRHAVLVRDPHRRSSLPVRFPHGLHGLARLLDQVQRHAGRPRLAAGIPADDLDARRGRKRRAVPRPPDLLRGQAPRPDHPRQADSRQQLQSLSRIVALGAPLGVGAVRIRRAAARRHARGKGPARRREIAHRKHRRGQHVERQLHQRHDHPARPGDLRKGRDPPHRRRRDHRRPAALERRVQPPERRTAPGRHREHAQRLRAEQPYQQRSEIRRRFLSGDGPRHRPGLRLRPRQRNQPPLRLQHTQDLRRHVAHARQNRRTRQDRRIRQGAGLLERPGGDPQTLRLRPRRAARLVAHAAHPQDRQRADAARRGRTVPRHEEPRRMALGEPRLHAGHHRRHQARRHDLPPRRLLPRLLDRRVRHDRLLLQSNPGNGFHPLGAGVPQLQAGADDHGQLHRSARLGTRPGRPPSLRQERPHPRRRRQRIRLSGRAGRPDGQRQGRGPRTGGRLPAPERHGQGAEQPLQERGDFGRSHALGILRL